MPATGDAEKQKKAAEFVTCMSNDENQLELAKQRYTVPTRTALLEEYIAEVPEMETFAEQVVNARARTGKLGTEWPAVATQMYNAIQLAITGKATPADAFAQAEKK